MNAQQLKNSILQEAIEGRLVPQDPNDEPASVLLDKIRKEKVRLVKEKLIYKKSETKPLYEEGDYPFDIPVNWKWVQLSDVSIIQEGAGIRKHQYTKKGTQLLCVTNILDGSIDFSKKVLYVSDNEYKEKYLHLTPQKGDIVTACSGGSWGKIAIFDCNEVVMLNTSTLRLRFFNDLANNNYLYYLAQSKFFKDQLACQLVGIQPNFGYAHYSRICFPLPPLAEQKRIVARIEELMPKVEEYGKAQESLDKLNEELPERLKKSILQDAIEGRLVPQDPNDEPASVLLAKIRMEKAKLVKEGKLKKKDIEEIPISDDEKPFDIPESWEWCRIGSIFNHSSGKQLSGSNTDGSLRKYITTSNLYWGRFELDNLKSMYYKDSELEKCTAKRGDLLVCEGGDIGRSAIWPYDYEICLQNHVHRLRPYDDKYTVFVFYIMLYYKNIGLIGGKGIGIQGLSASSLKSISIPIPPLAEQHRIVVKIEELFALIDGIKVS